jgi:hypothetical protein
MATFTAEANGAMNDDATWAGAGVPGVSDQTVNNGFVVTVTANHLTDGTGGHDVGSGGVMEGDAGITLRAGGGRMELVGTAILRHSGTGSGAFLVSQLAGQIIVANGTDEDNRVQILGEDATNHIRFDAGHTNDGTGRIQLDLCHMEFVGNASNALCKSYLASSAREAFITNTTAENCGEWEIDAVLHGEAIFRFNNNNFSSHAGAGIIQINDNPAALTTGVREVLDNYTDKPLPAAESAGQNFRDFTFSGSVAIGAMSMLSGGSPPAEVSGNLFVKDTQPRHIWAAPFTGNYFLQEPIDNAHFLGMVSTVTGTYAITGNIFEDLGTFGNGDGFLIPSGAGVAHFDVDYNIAGQNPSGGISCTIVSALGHTDKTFRARHNSFQTASGAVGIQGGETVALDADTCTGVYSNLAVGPAVTGLVVGSAGAPADGYYSEADFNLGWSTTGAAFTDNYGALADAKFGVSPPGANDVNVDPQLVDVTVNFAAWDASLGGPGTYANGMAELALMNTAAHDPNYTPAAAIAFYKSKWAPQNSVVQNAGHDGVTIGAVEFLAPAATGHGPLIGGQRNHLVRAA